MSGKKKNGGGWDATVEPAVQRQAADEGVTYQGVPKAVTTLYADSVVGCTVLVTNRLRSDSVDITRTLHGASLVPKPGDFQNVRSTKDGSLTTEDVRRFEAAMERWQASPSVWPMKAAEGPYADVDQVALREAVQKAGGHITVTTTGVGSDAMDEQRTLPYTPGNPLEQLCKSKGPSK